MMGQIGEQMKRRYIQENIARQTLKCSFYSVLEKYQRHVFQAERLEQFELEANEGQARR